MSKKLTPEVLRVKLQIIMKQAAENDMRVSTKDISAALKGWSLSEQQLHVIYDFLLSRKVIVEGYAAEKPDENTSAVSSDENESAHRWSDEEQRWLETYSDDLASIAPEKPGEWERLMTGIEKGDAGAKRRTAELFLNDVVREAERMYQPGIHLSDMIQEGSLNLVFYIDRMKDLLPGGLRPSEADREKISELIRGEIRSGISAMIAEQDEVHARDHKLVEKVEEFRDGVVTLKEEYGRKVYLDEVADFMNITEEEAEDILRLAGEEITDEETGDENGK